MLCMNSLGLPLWVQYYFSGMQGLIHKAFWSFYFFYFLLFNKVEDSHECKYKVR